jgi:hypothetical protein
VAHFKATVIILPNGILKIAGLPLEDGLYETDLKIEDEQLAALIKEALKPKKKKAKKTEGVEGKLEDEKKPVEKPSDDKKPAEKPAAKKPADAKKSPKKKN